MNSLYHGHRKILNIIINPVSTRYVVKDSFEAAAKINLISLGNINDGYTFKG